MSYFTYDKAKDHEKVVYLVRHGESEDNAAPVFQSLNTQLIALGLEQAKKVASRIADLDFEALISSPQKRAKQTALAMTARTGKQLEVSDLFVEHIKPVSIEGKSWDDAEASSLWREWQKSLVTPGYKVRGGENYDEIVARADKALDYLQGRQEAALVVVSHGLFIRTLVVRVLLGLELSHSMLQRFYNLIAIENTGITVFRYKDAFEEPARWRLWSLNDHAHFLR